MTATMLQTTATMPQTEHLQCHTQNGYNGTNKSATMPQTKHLQCQKQDAYNDTNKTATTATRRTEGAGILSQQTF